MAKRLQKYNDGDVFSVKLENGQYACGQILEAHVSPPLGPPSIVFFNYKCDKEENILQKEFLLKDAVATIMIAGTYSLRHHEWKILFNNKINIPREFYPFENKKNSCYIGATLHDSSIATKFINAYFACWPWDYYFDPAYFDKMLLSADKKPENLKYKKDYTEEELLALEPKPIEKVKPSIAKKKIKKEISDE